MTAPMPVPAPERFGFSQRVAEAARIARDTAVPSLVDGDVPTIYYQIAAAILAAVDEGLV